MTHSLKGRGQPHLYSLTPKMPHLALAGGAQWTKYGLAKQGIAVQFPVGAHPWVFSQVPSGEHMGGNHTLMFLSLTLSLKVNKFF